MTQHRREMRLMMAIIEGGDLEDEFMDLVIQGTGNTPFWLGQCVHLDTVAEDTEKLELQNRVALLEQRLAEPVSHLRFIQAVEGALTLRSMTQEMDELRSQNAELQRRVEQLEAEATANAEEEL